MSRKLSGFLGIVGLIRQLAEFEIGYCCFALLGAVRQLADEDLLGAGLEQGAEHFEVSRSR
jgi:hypothetical protein